MICYICKQTIELIDGRPIGAQRPDTKEWMHHWCRRMLMKILEKYA